MKFQITFSEKESMAMANLMAKFDFEKKLKMQDLTKKYREGNSAGHFEYSGLCKDGGKTTIDFESHEKLMLAAVGVYEKYSYTVNSIFCTIKGLVLNVKSLIKNFNIDYKTSLNTAFKEIEDEAKVEKIRKEAKAKAEADFKKTFDRIREIEKEEKADDDDELY
jgi:hypothetical protein